MRKFILGAGIVVGGSLLGAFGWKTHRLSGGGTHGTRLPQATATTFLKAAHRAPSATRVSQTSPAIALQYSKLPLAFEPNVGQMSKSADFFARGDGYALFLDRDGSTILLKGTASNKKQIAAALHAPPASSDSSSGAPRQQISPKKEDAAALRVELVSASKAAHFEPLEKLPGKSNYFLGNVPANWRTNVPNYREVKESGVYPGVDLAYYGTERQLESDFLVAPSADPDIIRLAFRGADHLRIDDQGDLNISVAGRNVSLHKPVAYQQAGAGRVPVAADYVLIGRNNVGFRIGKYDPSRELVIDPILSYSTYLGGSNIDGANAIAVAPDGTAFVAGGTFSFDFPTAHPLQPNHGGPDDFSRDAFVAKFSADGSTLLYSTYLGGENEDVANGIAVDNLGDAYVTGTTLSPHFPANAGSFNPECGGDGKCGASFNPGGLIVSNAFVSKLNPEGSGLIYSGFLGYYEDVTGFAIAVDANQVAYVTGSVTDNFKVTTPVPPPPNFPITTVVNPVPTTPTGFGGGATDAYVTAISATGTSILYSSYVGGNSEDVGFGIAADGNGSAFITGLTYSSSATFPVTPTAYQSNYGGSGDAFVTEVNTHTAGPVGAPVTSAPVYSTFFGGADLDQGNALAVDQNGNVYVTGLTNSSTLTVTPATARGYAGEGDAFIAKFNPAASGVASLVYFTYLGGSLADQGYGIAIDASNNDPQHPCTTALPCAVVTGSTVSTDFVPPVLTPTAFQPKYGGGNADAFIAKLDPTGANLIYSSYLGGTNTDIGYGIAVDTNGNAYVAGQTCSLDFPLANPEQPASGGNCDAFVSKISILHGLQLNPAGLVFNGQSLGTTSQPQTVTVTNGDAPQTVSAPTLAGPNGGDFQMTSTCGASLAPGAQCTITVTFTPTATAAAEPLRKAQVNIVCSTCGTSGITYVVNLSGQLSNLTLSASNVAFPNQQVGVASSPISITATNIGTTAISFSSITASGDYAETDDCTKVPLQPTTNCVISVTFTPTTAGSSIGALTLTDTASGSPQIILLTGTGVGVQSDFTMSLTPSSAAVSAGQSANLTLLVTSVGGFNQPVTLSCAGLPRNANCEAASNQVIPTAPATPFPLVVTTGLRTSVPPGFEIRRMPWQAMRVLVTGLSVLLLFWIVASFRRGRMRLATATLGFAVVLLLGSAGCSSGNQAGVPAGTPAGTYQVTVVGTSGNITRSTTVNLQVN